MAAQQNVLTAWRRFLASTELGPGPSEAILASWRRSRQAGVSPWKPQFRRVDPDDLALRLHGARELLAAAVPRLEQLSSSLPQSHALYLTDADGIVLWCRATSAQLAEECGLIPGYDWSEAQMGTNGAGTALVMRRSTAVIGCEHYCEAWHRAACLAAVIRARGRLAGAIDLTTDLAETRPEDLLELSRVADAIGSELS